MKIKPFKPIASIKDYLKEHDYYEPNPEGSQVFKHDRSISSVFTYLLPLIFFLILFIRLFNLQVTEGFINLRLAEGNRLKNVPIPAPRGMIIDDKGKNLVVNEPAYQLVINVTKKKDIVKLNPEAVRLAGLTTEEIIKKAENNSQIGFVILKDKLPKEEALVLKSKLIEFKEFEVVPIYSRVYQANNLCHILGFVGRPTEAEMEKGSVHFINNQVGKNGIEKTYDQYLQGAPGYKKAEVDVNGRIIRLLSTTQPVIGKTLVSSIDLDLQNHTSQVLEEKLKELKTQGTVIVMDPRDNSIKAMVSSPSYDCTKMSLGMSKDEYATLTSDKKNPLLNRAISGTYPAGSSIKPFIAASGLNFGVVNGDIAFDTPPFIEVGQWKFPDWKDHGTTDIKKAIAESNNIFFYAIGGGWGPIKNGLGPDRLKEGLEMFGFNKKTGIDLSAENSGFIPTPAWKKKVTKEPWYIGNTYNMSIGQGDLLVTPIQIAQATSVIANGGKLYKPHTVTKIIEGSSDIEIEMKSSDFLLKENIFSSDVLSIVKEGMRQTVTGGSARSVFGDDYEIEVSGKTGTAQFGNEGKTHAWFTSFAPYENPELVVMVLVEGSGEGNEIAAPIAKQIYDFWWANK